MCDDRPDDWEEPFEEHTDRMARLDSEDDDARRTLGDAPVNPAGQDDSPHANLDSHNTKQPFSERNK